MNWWNYNGWFAKWGQVSDIDPLRDMTVPAKTRWLDRHPPITHWIAYWIAAATKLTHRQRVLLPFAAGADELRNTFSRYVGLNAWLIEPDIRSRDALATYNQDLCWFMDVETWTTQFTATGTKVDVLLVHCPAKEIFFTLDLLWPYLRVHGTCCVVVPHGILFGDDAICQENREWLTTIGLTEWLEILPGMNAASERICLLYGEKPYPE